jgi:hypothetical protein
MEETIKLEMTAEEADQFRKLLAEFLKRIKELREQMAKDHLEIARYGAETQAIIDRLEGKAA